MGWFRLSEDEEVIDELELVLGEAMRMLERVVEGGEDPKKWEFEELARKASEAGARW